MEAALETMRRVEGGRWKVGNDHKASLRARYLSYRDEIAAVGDFVETGLPLFESEELTDALLRIYLGLSVNGWVAAEPSTPMILEQFAHIYIQGLWLPCCPRIALASRVDIRNDTISDFSAIPLHRADNRFEFVIAKKYGLPRQWAMLPGSKHSFWMGLLSGEADNERVIRKRISSNDVLLCHAWFYSLLGDTIVPVKNGCFPNGGPAAVLGRYGAAAIQTVSDFRFLWTVETEETPLSSARTTPLRLGVTEEMVASLFYARQNPISESGRRRPILHWVRSHQRRLRAGVSVDVRKHLRGVTEFEMDNFPFRITSPTKAVVGNAA